MHAGMPLPDLGELILKQNAAKRDVIAPAARLSFAAPEGKSPAIGFNLNGTAVDAALTDFAFRQIGQWAEIPAKYIERMSAPQNRALLEQNVNHWLHASTESRMVRLFSSDSTIARAFLSDRYRPLDNFDLAHAIMPKITSNGLTVKSASLTETKLYLQVVDQKLMARLNPSVHQRDKDDTVYAGCVISNSEVGAGSLLIEPMVYRVICTNGLISGTSLRRNHIGRGLGGDEAAVEYFSDDTRRLDDIAFWAKVSDVINAAFDEARFRALVAKLQAATTVELPMDPQLIVDVTARRLDLNETEKDQVLRHLFQSGDPTVFGLTQAVTRTAQDATSYDRAIDLERLGSDVLSFKASDFILSAN